MVSINVLAWIIQVKIGGNELRIIWIIGVWLEMRDKNKNTWNDRRKSLRCRLGILSAMLINPIRPQLHELATPPPISTYELTSENHSVNYVTYTKRRRGEFCIFKSQLLFECFWVYKPSTALSLLAILIVPDARAQPQHLKGRPSALLEGFKFKPVEKQLGCWFSVSGFFSHFFIINAIFNYSVVFPKGFWSKKVTG